MCTVPNKVSDAVHQSGGPQQVRSSRRGFTMIELLIVLAVMSVLMSIVAPRFNEYRDSWELESAAQQLVGDVHRARIEAFKRNQVVWLTMTSSTAYTTRFLGVSELPGVTTFSSGVGDTVKFTSFGPTLTGPVDLSLQHSGRTMVVRVDAAGGTQVVRP